MNERLSGERQQKSPIEYPYLPENGKIEYVGADNEFMQLAKEYAKQYSLDQTMPNTSVIVYDGEVLGIGANGSDFHENNGCERVRQNIPSGQGYDLCDGCSPKNHGEQTALKNAQEITGETTFDGAVVYLWGHWWCCESCWSAIQTSGIDTVYLLDDSENLFNKEAPGNIVGRQFE